MLKLESGGEGAGGRKRAGGNGGGGRGVRCNIMKRVIVIAVFWDVVSSQCIVLLYICRHGCNELDQKST